MVPTQNKQWDANVHVVQTIHNICNYGQNTNVDFTYSTGQHLMMWSRGGNCMNKPSARSIFVAAPGRIRTLYLLRI